jgi:hypothetical protein
MMGSFHLDAQIHLTMTVLETDRLFECFLRVFWLFWRFGPVRMGKSLPPHSLLQTSTFALKFAAQLASVGI